MSVERAKRIADEVVPEYRKGGKVRSCAGVVAKRWTAAYYGALTAMQPETLTIVSSETDTAKDLGRLLNP